MPPRWPLITGSQRPRLDKGERLGLTLSVAPVILRPSCAISPPGLSSQNIRAATPRPSNLELFTADAVSSRRPSERPFPLR